MDFTDVILKGLSIVILIGNIGLVIYSFRLRREAYRLYKKAKECIDDSLEKLV